jgi:hypothetical protein
MTGTAALVSSLFKFEKATFSDCTQKHTEKRNVCNRSSLENHGIVVGHAESKMHGLLLRCLPLWGAFQNGEQKLQ